MHMNCPHCNQRFDAGDDVLGVEIQCPACSKTFTVPKLAPVMPPPMFVVATPSPSLQQGVPAHMTDAPDAPAGRPGALVALTVLSCVHIAVNVVIFFVGIAKGNGVAIGGGLFSVGFYIAILIGLIKMQEWARIMIIWLAYCGIVFSLGVFAPLEIPTLILAHWPSVRKATKGASMAKAYTYHEHQKQKGEEGR
ncbi:MAG: hypothetical protein NT088_05230 [Candidatus Omnitrophica bacterium]|nr:hypothetical protein [Candidatus Omnitrophota bacterium]